MTKNERLHQESVAEIKYNCARTIFSYLRNVKYCHRKSYFIAATDPRP